MPPLAPIRSFTPRSNLFGDTLSSSGGSDHRMDLCGDSDSDYKLLHARAVHARARAAQAIRPSTPPTLLLTAPASPEHASASGATSFASCQSFTSAEMEAVSLHIEQIQTVWTAMRAAARDAAARAHGPKGRSPVRALTWGGGGGDPGPGLKFFSFRLSTPPKWAKSDPQALICPSFSCKSSLSSQIQAFMVVLTLQGGPQTPFQFGLALWGGPGPLFDSQLGCFTHYISNS